MESKTVSVDGIRVRWEEEGSGQPIIFIHGIPTSPRLWRYVMPHVHGGRKMAWEMVGYGASIREGYNRDISVARQAEYLVAWMRQLGLTSAILVGHDLGGGVAQIVAVRYPTLVRGLVLADTVAYDSWPILSVKVMRRLSPIVSWLPKPLFRLLFAMFLYRGHDNSARAKEALAVHWPYYESADGAAAFVKQIQSLNAQDTLTIAPNLAELELPARLVWGLADQFQKINCGYWLAHDLRAPLQWIDGAKHFIPEDHPERVAAAVDDLLRRSQELAA